MIVINTQRGRWAISWPFNLAGICFLMVYDALILHRYHQLHLGRRIIMSSSTGVRMLENTISRFILSHLNYHEDVCYTRFRALLI
jgi:TRAP-type uncharacterized transport system fused permease subunit